MKRTESNSSESHRMATTALAANAPVYSFIAAIVARVEHGMRKCANLLGSGPVALTLIATMIACLAVKSAAAQQERRPAFVIVERKATTGDESIQDEYAKLAREILPKGLSQNKRLGRKDSRMRQ
jgi:hypothetical protein